MADSGHEALTRSSFDQQTALFSDPNSPFAIRSGGHAWIDPLDSTMVVLDVACGAGHAAESIAPRVRQVIGIDLTRSLLDLGAERLRDNGVANVTLEEGNAEHLPFVGESFDVVFCRSSLHHFESPHKAVSEMVRVCRIGGRVVLLDIVPPSNEVRQHFDHVHRLIDPSHVRSFLEGELADLVPGGREGLAYANTFDIRLPIDVALTEQSESDEAMRLLREEITGAGEPTGLGPEEDDGTVVVSFTTCVVHACKAE